MSFNVIIEPGAAIDIECAFDYYSMISEKLGLKFLKTVESKINLLSENPYLFQTKYQFYKTIFLNDFPYLIHYFIDKTNQEIHILSVLHTSRNSNIWPSDI